MCDEMHLWRNQPN